MQINRFALMLVAAACINAGSQFNLASAQAPAATAPAVQTIKVSNPKELLAAIGSNRIIQVAADTIDLGQVEHTESDNVGWGARSMTVRNVKNLTIVGTGEKPVHIGTPDAGTIVMVISDSSHVTLKNLELVHDVKGPCAGGVLDLRRCEDVTVEKVTLSGSGREGLTASMVDGLEFKNSTITHCSNTIMTATELVNARFTDSQFTDNTVISTPLEFEKSQASFTNCTFSKNVALVNRAAEPAKAFVSSKGKGKIAFETCTFTLNQIESFIDGNGAITTKDCKAPDNSFTLDSHASNKPPAKAPAAAG